MKLWSDILNGGWLQDWLGDAISILYWGKIFENVYRGKTDTWDYQWTFACWMQSALAILPNQNLVSNIGFSSGATHTKRLTPFAEMNTEATKFPLSHPSYILRDAKADLITERKMYSSQPLFPRAINKIKDIVPTFRRSPHKYHLFSQYGSSLKTNFLYNEG